MSEKKDLSRVVEAFTNSDYTGKVFTVKAEINGKTLEFSSKIKPVYTLENEIGCITFEFENGCKVDLSPDQYVFSEDGIKGKYLSIGPREVSYSINDLFGKTAIDNPNYGKNAKPEVVVQLNLEDALISFKSSEQTFENKGKIEMDFSNGCKLAMPSEDFEAIKMEEETKDYALSITTFLIKKF